MSASTDAQAAPLICQVCGTYFETRRGLSSHARLHLRQLGVTLSESSGAPIELLYQLIKEREGSLPEFKKYCTPEPSPLKKTNQQESRTSSVPEKTTPSFIPGVRVLTSPYKMDHPGSPVRSKESAATVLLSSPSAQRLSEGSSSSSTEHQTPTKPLWAPLETDAPITLASETTEEVYVCQLCGCWYETRKGLSSHARAHLRQIGIPDSDIKGSAIDFLHRIMEEEDLKPMSSEQQETLTACSATGLSDLTSPPPSPPCKRPKTSKECTCVLCGEQFENRKGLGSHARSHLRQMGMTGLMGKSSALDTIQELVSSGMLEAARPPNTSSGSSSSSAASVSPARSPALSLSQRPVKGVHSPPSGVSKAPKAKKGFRLAVDPLLRKLKPEPVEIELSISPEKTLASSPQKSPPAFVASKPLSGDVQVPPTVLCDFCGQLFDTRKALSCHVRAHLRQLGLTWSIRTSPIDLLKQVMLHGEEGLKGSASGKAMWSPPGSKKPPERPQSKEPASTDCTAPLDYSMKAKSPSGKSDTSCQLCGFNFENRKALASHARAHLRQLGIVEWKADGATSPIELLSELIRRDPIKVAAITRRYRSGDLYIKKVQKPAGSPSLSTDSDSVPGSRLKLEHRTGREGLEIMPGSSRQTHTRALAGRSSPGVRSPRGVHPPKHTVARGGQSKDNNSQQPPRSGSIPAMLPKPPLTPLVKMVGKIYSLKCRFCEQVFHGPLSVQEQWITHLQKHIQSLGYKGKESPPVAPVVAPVLVGPVAV